MRSEIEISVETTGSHHLISARSLNSACRGLLESEGAGGEEVDGLCGMVVGGDTAVMSVFSSLSAAFVVMGCNERVESVVEPRFQRVQVGDHDLLRFWLRVQVLGVDLIALQHILDQRLPARDLHTRSPFVEVMDAK